MSWIPIKDTNIPELLLCIVFLSIPRTILLADLPYYRAVKHDGYLS